MGRFISQDSYLGELGTPPSLHRYLYAYGNPTVFIDLDGAASVNIFGEKVYWNVERDWVGPFNPTTRSVHIGDAPLKHRFLRGSHQPTVKLSDKYGRGEIRTEDLKRASEEFLWDKGDISRLDENQQDEAIASYVNSYGAPKQYEGSTANAIGQIFKESVEDYPKNVALKVQRAFKYPSEHPGKTVAFVALGQVGAAAELEAKMTVESSTAGTTRVVSQRAAQALREGTIETELVEGQYVARSNPTLYRKMSVAEAEKTLKTGLQPARRGADPTKWTSESIEKVNAFENKIVQPGTEEVVVEFEMNPQYYKQMQKNAIPQRGSKGKPQVKYHYEGLEEGGDLKNYGITPEELEKFNSNIENIRTVKAPKR